MTLKEKRLAVMFCAPLSEYPEKPEDYSKSELIDCPTCNKPMWFSEKKKNWMEISIKNGMEILLECFICFKKRVEKNPELYSDHVRINI
jgi:hypothetical protein